MGRVWTSQTVITESAPSPANALTTEDDIVYIAEDGQTLVVE